MDGSLILAVLAGAAGGALLLAGRLLAAYVDPRPCYQKNDCALKRADPEACSRCPVWLDRDVPVETFLTKELNLPPLRSFVEGEVVKAA